MLDNEQLKILKKVQSGELSPAEGAERLEMLEGGIEVIPPPAPAHENLTPELGWWKYAWLVLVGVGLVVFIPGAFLTSWAYSNERYFWFYCSWLPLLFGLVILLIGLWSVQARWVHLNIQEAKGTRIAFSLPLPLSLSGWLLRTFSKRIPGLDEKHLQDAPAILDALRLSKDPIAVEVDDEDGDRVRVYIL